MTDYRSPNEIEREIERERAGLTDTLEDLQGRLSIDGIMRQLTDQVREHGGDIGAALSRSVKDNPMALALTGVGLAWMIFGDKHGDRRNDGDVKPGDSPGYSRRGAWTMSERVRGGGRYFSQGGAPSAGDVPAWMRSSEEPFNARSDYGDGPDHRLTDRPRDTFLATDTLERKRDVGPSVSDRVSHFGSSVSDAASAGRETVSDAATSAANRADMIRSRLAEGTHSMSEAARERVIAARERALEARQTAASHVREGRDRAVDLFEDQPIIAGTLALAVGAAIGAALPRTQIEDDYLGEQSDSLIHEAERIFAEEKAKIGAVANAALDEAMELAQEAKGAAEDAASRIKADADRAAPGDETAIQSVAGDAKETAKDAAERIGDAARSEADNQHLGKPRL